MALRSLVLVVVALAALAAVSQAAIVCRHCGQVVFSEEDYDPNHVPENAETQPLPIVGPHAVKHTVQNPTLGEHQTLVTFSEAAATTKTSPYLEVRDTYFPPYHWAPLQCQCNHHIGWTFYEVTEDESDTAQTSRSAAAPSATTTTASSASTPPQDVTTSAAKSTPSSASREVGYDASVTDTSSTSTGEVVTDETLTEEFILRKLNLMKGTCFSLHRGWWTYEWCHEKHVRQYHRDTKGKIEMDWSLGQFDREDRVARTTAPISPHYKYSQFYLDGQICHETKKNRRTEVQFFCCPKQFAESGKTPPVATLEDILEPSLCRYRAIVCVPSLCTEKEKDAAAVAASMQKTGSDNGGSTAAATSSSTPLPTVEERRKNSRKVFHAALWSAVVSTQDEELKWIDSMKPASGIQHPGA